MPRDLLRVAQQSSQTRGRIRQIKTRIFVCCANDKLVGQARNEVRSSPPDHFPESAMRHAQREDLTFSRVYRDHRIQTSKLAAPHAGSDHDIRRVNLRVAHVNRMLRYAV